jgi:hypothetical protein
VARRGKKRGVIKSDSRRLAAAYFRAIVAGRRLSVVSARLGVSVRTLYRCAALWPEHIDRLKKSTTLRSWERENLNRYLERRNSNG